MDIKQNVYVKDIKNKGKSLFANKTFKRGEFIFLIAGPIVTKSTIYTVPIAKGLWINPVPFNNLGKYINHSCNPNGGIQQRTMVVAFKNIRKDEERKSLAFRVVFQSPEKTLTGKEVDLAQQRIVKELQKNPSWEVRD